MSDNEELKEEEPDVEDVAKWMIEQIEDKKPLYQDNAAWEIKKKFGANFVYANENGNPAIARPVLEKFRNISGDEIVWSRGDFCWRLRRKRDRPGRQQD
ncbi:MAG: hypothetical protein ACFCUR_02540 [Rhodomicrobiaceae bacterium]